MTDAKIPPPRHRQSATFTPTSTATSAVRQRQAFMTSAGAARNAKSPALMICCSWGLRSLATLSKATARNAKPIVTLVACTPQNPIELDIPITIAGMSFGALSGPAKEALGARRIACGHVHHHRRRRHDTRRTRAFQTSWSINICPRAMA